MGARTSRGSERRRCSGAGGAVGSGVGRGRLGRGALTPNERAAIRPRTSWVAARTVGRRPPGRRRRWPRREREAASDSRGALMVETDGTAADGRRRSPRLWPRPCASGKARNSSRSTRPMASAERWRCGPACTSPSSASRTEIARLGRSIRATGRRPWPRRRRRSRSRVVSSTRQLVELGLAGGQHPPEVGAAKAAAGAAPGRPGDLVESPATGPRERQQLRERHHGGRRTS